MYAYRLSYVNKSSHSPLHHRTASFCQLHFRPLLLSLVLRRLPTKINPVVRSLYIGISISLSELNVGR